jgi:hypothetical protein
MKYLIPIGVAMIASFQPTDTVQYVMFQTTQARAPFIAVWTPFASSFIRNGLEHIVLSESSAATYKFISRNLWSKSAFERTFGTTRIANGSGNGIRAIQAGAYRSSSSLAKLEQAQNATKIMAFFSHPKPAQLKEKLLEITKNQNAILLEPANQSAIFDLVLEVYNPNTGLYAQLQRLEPSQIALYDEVLTLP